MNLNVKHLNRILLFLFAGTLLCLPLMSQQIQGIYLSADDFQKGKLSFAKMQGKKCKVKLHDELYKPYLGIKYCDSSYRLNKDSVYGYKDLDGGNFRFYNRRIYQVLNQGEEIQICKTERISGGPKNQQIITEYFFSAKASSGLLPLTIYNLENAFRENKMFIEFMEIHFRDDSDLTEYDHLHKKFKLNRLLELSRIEKK